MTQVFAFILALLKAVPIIDGWFEDLVAYYVATRLAELKAENREAIQSAFAKQDQRDLEKAIGNPSPGDASGAPGAEIRDHLPGVKP